MSNADTAAVTQLVASRAPVARPQLGDDMADCFTVDSVVNIELVHRTRRRVRRSLRGDVRWRLGRVERPPSLPARGPNMRFRSAAASIRRLTSSGGGAGAGRRRGGGGEARFVGDRAISPPFTA
jgi:hypothetical protein